MAFSCYQELPGVIVVVSTAIFGVHVVDAAIVSAGWPNACKRDQPVVEGFISVGHTDCGLVGSR